MKYCVKVKCKKPPYRQRWKKILKSKYYSRADNNIKHKVAYIVTSEFTLHFIKYIQYKNLDFKYLQYIIPLICKKSNTAIAKNKKMGYNKYVLLNF